MVGIFGAGMSTIRMVDGTRACINNYATAPAAARADMYRCLSNTWPDYQNVAESENDVGPLAVAVPGSLRGWCDMLALYGRFALADVVQPAIRFARNGFLVTQYLHDIVRQVAHDMARFPETARNLSAGRRAFAGRCADRAKRICRRAGDDCT